MTPLLLTLLIAAAVIIGPILMLRPRGAKALPMPAGGLAQLDTLVPLRARLDAEQRARHAQQVERFLLRKRFVGCNDLLVTDEMRITVAGYACLMVLRPRAEVFPAVKAVLLYPEAFLVPVNEPDELGLVDDEPQARIGESWHGDRVILSWEDVLDARAGAEHNVVVHEFAHQLDDESPGVLGAPALRDYTRWAEIMDREYRRLRRHRRPVVLDAYGGESPQEFFAVVTESFFQRGAELLQHHAELYALMRDYYGFDTASSAH